MAYMHRDRDGAGADVVAVVVLPGVIETRIRRLVCSPEELLV